MTVSRTQLHELADQAVRDIVELDAQVAAGEIPAEAAASLRHRYEGLAGQAIQAIDGDGPEQAAPDQQHPPRAWTLVHGLAGVAALVAAVVLLPNSLLARPSGGFVTGNEVLTASGAPPLDPTVSITDGELEGVVAANPDVVGMRLALADRYVAEGEYDRAMRHYLDALRREPRNPEGLAHVGWLLWQIHQDGPAWDSVTQALTIDPTLQDALWFRAVIALYGRNDPATALATLQQLERAPLSPQVAGQVQQLAATARERAGGTP